MFHTLFDYPDQNVANNKQIPKTKSKGFINKSSKNKSLYENYYGKGNQAYDLYNKNDNDSNNSQSSDNESEKFEKTTNKVRVTLYKNGFILNNGPFRDKSVPENEEFLEQMGRGVIPHELVEEGINDLGILLVNRKAETYHMPKKHNIFNLHNNDIFNYPSNIGQNQYKKNPQNNKKNIIPLGMSRINSSRNFLNIPKRIDLNKHKDKKITRQNCSEPKDKEDEKKSFKAFSGSGKLIRNVSTQGLRVNKNLKTNIDIYQPVCTISIRLFNGEVAKCQFNYSQTLRDIYYHVRNISGSNNFFLLDGFPPRPLRDYDRTIYELKLQNTLLTQKIN